MFLFFLIPILTGLYYLTRENFGNTECPTRNMSYDLRGEAFFPERTNYPFNTSVIGPSNKNCYPKKLNFF